VRKVEYWIPQCYECPFYEDAGEDNICHETTIEDKHFEYPFKSDWFPEWCPLEKEK
jgi:hypothetical protein